MVGRRTPPTLETSRLLLRGWRPHDLGAHTRMMADPEVMRYLGEGRTGGRSKAAAEIATHVAHWALRGYMRPDLASMHDRREGSKAVNSYARRSRRLWVKLGAWPWWPRH